MCGGGGFLRKTCSNDGTVGYKVNQEELLELGGKHFKNLPIKMWL